MIDGTFTLNGLTIGLDPYILTAAPEGILDTASIRVEDRPRPRRQGIIAGDDLMAGRNISFELAILGVSPADAEAKAVALVAAFAPAAKDVWLSARVSGTPSEYAYLGRARGATVLLENVLYDYEKATVYARCSFVAIDPVRYQSTGQSVSISVSASGSGLMYPVTYPIVYALAGGSGTGVAFNSGTAPVDWVATFTGPLTNPRIEQVDTGLSIKILATLAAGETVVLDSSSGSILLGGTTPRPSWFAPGSKWFQLLPGSNLLRLTADVGTGSVNVEWRSGWY